MTVPRARDANFYVPVIRALGLFNGQYITARIGTGKAAPRTSPSMFSNRSSTG